MQEEGFDNLAVPGSSPTQNEQAQNDVHQQYQPQLGSLLASASFNSREDKDLELGLAIKDQVGASGIPKGSLRAISVVWLTKYLEYIDKLATRQEAKQAEAPAVLRPSPIMNFDLLHMQPEYLEKLQVALHHADPATWCDMFNDWEYMELMQELVRGRDYYLLNQTNWTKLRAAFGGGPEIPFFQYQEDTLVAQADGSQETVKEARHDFDPIRVCVSVMKRSRENNGQSITLLVSKHMTHLQFKNYLAQVWSDVGSRVDMFVVKAPGQPIIAEVGKEKRTLKELGIVDLSNVVIFDSDAVPEKTNKSDAFNMIAQQFGIEKSQYEQLLPTFEPEQNPVDEFDFYTGSPPAATTSKFDFNMAQEPVFNNQQATANVVPPEYANDPDLWYAIQASMGVDAGPAPSQDNQYRAAIDPIDAMMDIDEAAFENHSPRAAAMEVAHNVSMEGGSTGTPKRTAELGPIFDETEFGPSSQAPQVQQSALVQQINHQNQQMTRAEHAKSLRERRRAQFEEKQEQAKLKMQLTGFGSQSVNNGTKESLRGQLGQQFRQFSEVSQHLHKLRSNFDQIITGTLTVTQMYEQAAESCDLMSAGGLMSTMHSGKSQALTKTLKSAGSVMAGDEIDSECRTDPGEENHSTGGGL